MWKVGWGWALWAHCLKRPKSHNPALTGTCYQPHHKPTDTLMESTTQSPEIF